MRREAAQLEIISGLYIARTPDFSDRKEKMTDVNIAVHAVRDLVTVKPSGIVLVSGDRDFMPVVEVAARAKVPVAVFFPQEHPLYQLPIGVDYAERVEITYLTREIMRDCRLSDGRWLEYLRIKARDRKRFQTSLDYEIALQKPTPKPAR